MQWGGGGMADAVDLKSIGRDTVWVRLPPALPKIGAVRACLRRCPVGFGSLARMEAAAFFKVTKVETSLGA